MTTVLKLAHKKCQTDIIIHDGYVNENIRSRFQSLSLLLHLRFRDFTLPHRAGRAIAFFLIPPRRRSWRNCRIPGHSKTLPRKLAATRLLCYPQTVASWPSSNNGSAPISIKHSPKNAQMILHGRLGICLLYSSSKSISHQWAQQTSERYYLHEKIKSAL